MPSLIDLLLAYGLCFGFMNKVTFLRKVKFFDRMLSCSYCTGFHAGWIAWLLSRPLYGVSLSLEAISPVILWAFASAAFCYAADVALQLAEGFVPEK